MEVGIIGAGSLGLLYSYYLSINQSVTLYTNKAVQANLINEKGITVQRENNVFHINMNANDSREYKEQFLIITVKQYQLEEIIEKLKDQPAKTILFLQNGMGHIRFMPEISHHRILFGVSEHGALKLNETTVKHTGIGMTKIAFYDRQKIDSEITNTLINNEHSLFMFKLFTEWEPILKEKLVVNATINSLTSVLKVKNGELISDPYFKKLLYELFLEVIDVLNERDVDGLWLHVVKICENTAGNVSSMYKDVKEGRQTEIDSILGYLIDHAYGKNIPYIRFLYYAVKGIENEINYGRG